MSSGVLAVRQFTSQSAESNELPLVCLHGWGHRSNSFDVLAKALSAKRDVLLVDLPGFGESRSLNTEGLASLLDAILTQLPCHFALLGWSLGGMLATQLTSMQANRVKALITLACNPKFVASGDWESAMPESTFQAFSDDFAHEPQKTIQRFIALQGMGDQQRKFVLQALSELQAPFEMEQHSQWQQSLSFLNKIDNRQVLRDIDVPALHLLGEGDQLVPAQVHNKLLELVPHQRVISVPGAGHAFHLSQTQRVVSEIDGFLAGQKRVRFRDKGRLAQAFNAASHSYDHHALLQRKAADKVLGLANTYSQFERDNAAVLDLGCGTGFLSDVCATYPNVNYFGLDIASGMLTYARAKYPEPRKQWLAADMEYLPIRSHSQDLVISNFSMQWIERLELVFAEIERVLLPGGLCVISSLGPKTLNELRSSWAQIDEYVHVNAFASECEINTALASTQLELVIRRVDIECYYYAQLIDLMRDLKGIGAQNHNRGRRLGLTGKRQLKALCTAYEEKRQPEGLPATYEIHYLVLKPK